MEIMYLSANLINGQLPSQLGIIQMLDKSTRFYPYFGRKTYVISVRRIKHLLAFFIWLFRTSIGCYVLCVFSFLSWLIGTTQTHVFVFHINALCCTVHFSIQSFTISALCAYTLQKSSVKNPTSGVPYSKKTLAVKKLGK